MPKKTAPRRQRIVYEELGGLLKHPFPGNPKKHDLDFMKETVDEHGFVMPVLVDDSSNLTGAGHGRLEELKRRRDAGESAPDGIEVRSGKWFVPVIRGVRFKNKEQLRKYVLADNRGVELGGWDNGLLAAALGKIGDDDLVGTGFDDDDVVRFMAMSDRSDPAKGKTDPDDVPANAPAVTKRGDLWILGKHRLLCGDATVLEDVKRLMAGARAVLMNTDAPYGVDYVGLKLPALYGNTQKWEEIENDDLDAKGLREMLDKVFSSAPLVSKAALYIWHPSGELNEVFRGAMTARDWLVHKQIVWAKPRFVLSPQGMYHWSHETCFYGWARGKTPPWFGPKDQRTVWSIGRDDGKAVHPTQKPVELFEIPMKNHTAPGGVCYEPFSGSGSQIIAGERLGRRVYAIDISPRYVDTAVARWEAFTGKKAKRG